MRREKYDLSTPAGRALKLLHDPQWSWNRFPRKQINYVMWSLNHPLRALGLFFYKINERFFR